MQLKDRVSSSLSGSLSLSSSSQVQKLRALVSKQQGNVKLITQLMNNRAAESHVLADWAANEANSALRDIMGTVRCFSLAVSSLSLLSLPCVASLNFFVVGVVLLLLLSFVMSGVITRQ